MDVFPLRLKRLATAMIASSMMTGAFVCGSMASAAEKMDLETHSLLIGKLERALDQGDASNVANGEVRLRLADLLAERARLHVLNAQGATSTAAQADRRKALQNYRTIVNRLDGNRRATVLMQMAHLHEALGEDKKAIEIYSRIEREGVRAYPREAVGLALSSWGDNLYRKGEFAKALVKFEASKSLSARERQGYVAYRIAWCQLNLGRLEQATTNLIAILRTPELLVRKSSDGSDVDTSFHEDVARDLVIFLARGSVTPQRVRLLLELSPEPIARENLRALATETERLGKKKEAIYVWALILEDNPSKVEQIDGRVRLATLEWGLGNKPEAAAQLASAAGAWRKLGCKDDECPAIKARIRKLVVDWARLEKERVTIQLAEAYGVYNSLFDDEYDMHFWAAQTSRILKRYNESSALYRQSSILAHKELGRKENAEIRKMFEAALLAQIEMAEQGGNLDVKLAAYDHYLDLNSSGERALEVRYQRARVYYDKGQHGKAAIEFRDVANAKAGAGDIKKKAADLSLDALVLAKQEKKIESAALVFADRFPQARTEYLNIARRAVLKEVATISNDTSSSDGDLRYAAKRLRDVNLEGTTKDERLLIFRNHLILAVRTRDLAETDRAADRLLTLKEAPAADRELALEKKVWAAEMRLDFERAYLLTKKMELPKKNQGDRHMRLAYLAELAGRRAGKHYEDVLATSRSRSQRELAAARLVRSAKNPWRELDRHQAVLRRNGDLYADLVLENFARTRDARRVQSYLRQPQLRRHAAGAVIERHQALKEINAFDRKIAGHRLVGSSERLMNRTLTQRLGLLKQAEAMAQQTLRAGDFTLQAVTLSIAARENERLHAEILKLPTPSKLSLEQKKQYEVEVAKQAAPFEAKADEINRQLAKMWSNDAAIETVAQTLDRSAGATTSLLAEDARALAARAPSSARRRIEAAIAKAGDRPSGAEILSARRALARDPFSERQAERLKAMELLAGRDAMVAHLDARLSQIRGGGK